MAIASVQPAQVVSLDYAHVERIGFGICMVVAPIFMLGAAFLHPAHGIEGTQYYHAADDYSPRFYVAHTLFFLAAVLFVPAIVGLARLVHARHPKAAFRGCLLSLRASSVLGRWTARTTLPGWLGIRTMRWTRQ
jgi:hypothetical protein